MVQQAAPLAAVPEVAAPTIDDLAQLSAREQVSTESLIPPAEAPAAEVAPAPVPPAPQVSQPPIPPTISPEVQEYISRLEQQNANVTSQQEAQTVKTLIAEQAQTLARQAAEQYGITVEQAMPFVQEIASNQVTALYRQYQAQQMRTGQVRAAISIAQEFGVDPMQLLDLPSPQAMRQTAETLRSGTRQSQELAALRAQVAKLTKAAVPAQTFTQGAQPGAGAGLAGDALEAAWLKHETTQPDRPNPYDSAYRAMLRG